MATLAFQAMLIFVLCTATQAKPCPEVVPSRSGSPNLLSKSRTVYILNKVDEKLLSTWVDPEGKEQYLGNITPLNWMKIETYPGHVHRFYTQRGGFPSALHLEYQVSESWGDQVIIAEPCGDSKAAAAFVMSSRSAEFEALSLPEDGPCDPTSDSSKWSCIRFLSIEDVAKRNPDQYGFHEGEGADGKATHYTVDTAYVKQIQEVPQVTPSGPGYTRMKFSQALLDIKAWWDDLDPFEKRGTPEIMEGGFTNAGTFEINITNLDMYTGIQEFITQEVRDYMQWWTGLRLAHSATYGVRTYHRDNVLVDHVDRAESRILCAVMQMSQTTDANGGWPLEILLPNGTVGEIFLQPGELVLLESAWLMHGRPMRFRGTNYSIVMVHFRPFDWDDTQFLKGNRYYGVPKERLTTLADKGYVKSDSFSWPSAVWDFASSSLTRLWESCRA